jgi:16S rRNA (uracil1498-N3)-methyltransferase
MTRLFLPPEYLTSKQISITGEQARYLIRVLRSKPGDSVTVLDGSGYKYECRLLTVNKKDVQAEVIHKAPYSVESPVSITLVQGIPKGEKMDFIIQKSTELGVTKIIPLITRFSQVRHTAKSNPTVTEPVSFEEFLKQYTSGHGIIFSEDEKEKNLKKILYGFQGASEITLLVGPEGGFSKDEVRAALQKGFISVSLGPRILRTETAPLTAISIIQYEIGDIG